MRQSNHNTDWTISQEYAMMSSSGTSTPNSTTGDSTMTTPANSHAMATPAFLTDEMPYGLNADAVADILADRNGITFDSKASVLNRRTPATPDGNTVISADLNHAWTFRLIGKASRRNIAILMDDKHVASSTATDDLNDIRVIAPMSRYQFLELIDCICEVNGGT